MKEFEMVMLIAKRELLALKKEVCDIASTETYEIGTFDKVLSNYTQQAQVEKWLRSAELKIKSEGGGE